MSNAPASTRLGAYAQRLDAMSLRERFLVLVCGVAVVVGVLFLLVLDPARLEAKRQADQVTQWQEELLRLSNELRESVNARASSPSGALKAQLDAQGAVLAALEQDIARTVPDASVMRSLQPAVANLLSEHPRVQLVALRVTPAPVVAQPVSAATSSTATSAAAPSAGVQRMVDRLARHELQFTVEGRYLDLLTYVQALEQKLPQLHWSGIKLMSDERGLSRLDVSLYLSTLKP